MGPHELAVMTGPDTGDAQEIGLLKHALRVKFGLASDHGPDFGLMQGTDAARLYRAARYNKLVLLFGSCVLNVLPEGIRAPLSEMVERYRARTVLMNARMISETVSVSAVLAKQKIAFVVMKGVGQQKALYGEYFAKPVGDVDILVPPRQYRRARAVLQSHGFTVADDCRSLWWRLFLGEQHLIRAGNPPVTIDLHYRLQQPGSPSPREGGTFIEQHETISLAGSAVPVLSRFHRPLLSSISIAKALFNREACGGYACDFFADVNDMKGEETRELMRRAELHGLEDTVLLGFRVASLLFGARFAMTEPSGAAILADTSDADLTAMVLAPWAGSIKWPHRRDVLRELCGREVLRFAKEAGWAATADLCRRMSDRGDRSKPSFETTGAVGARV